MPQPWIIIGIYGVVFAVILAGMLAWRVRQRKDRRPFPDNFKLLRGPGESQRRLLTAQEEKEIYYLMAAMLLPVLVAALLLWVTTHLAGAWQITGLVAALFGLLASIFFVVRFLVNQIVASSNRYLGYFGERVVAEALEPLKAQGYRVFHDVPAGDAKHPFNLDHVVVGPSGVFAIETKTRRKGRARHGFAAHEIIYDGKVLAYPWGEDRHGLDQAQRQARWLVDFLGQLLGVTIPVQPILTFPGWMIMRRGAGAVTVLNPREIPSAVLPRASATPVLSAAQIDLIARQLDARCRDVEY